MLLVSCSSHENQTTIKYGHKNCKLDELKLNVRLMQISNRENL